ncbi:MAG: hypothetical protein J6B81_02810 [Spirochaetaceae bacterium]|nr:hypothetical protein [Spirochaetaceae bacterium]
MRKLTVLLCILVVSILFGCSKEQQSDDYTDLIYSCNSYQDLIQKVYEFELKNPLHFDSKLVLAKDAIAEKNYNLAWQYLRHGENIVLSKKNNVSEKKISSLYFLLAELSFISNEHDMAADFVEKALATNIDAEDDNLYLIGHIFLAQGKQEESISAFEKAFENSVKATDSDYLAYMYALSQANRFQEIPVLLEAYTEKFPWFLGFGSFASSVYEQLQDIPRSLIYSYLDFDYASGFQQTDYEEQYQNLCDVEATFNDEQLLQQVKPTLELLKGLCKKTTVICDKDALPAGFGSKYLYLKNLSSQKLMTNHDFTELLSIEQFFSSFPAYYLLLWDSARQLFPQSFVEFIPALKKTIALNPDGFYADLARKEVSMLLDRTDHMEDISLFNSILF